MVIPSTITLLTRQPILALLSLVVQWMILTLLPAMALVAIHLVGAAVWVITDEISGLPVRARDRLVRVSVGLSAVILPVVGVDTEGFVMFREVEWAEFGLVVEHVEVGIIWVVVDKFNCDIFLRVSKATVISIFTPLQIIWIRWTKFRLILILLVQLLHSVMSHLAVVTIRTLALLGVLA